MIFSITADGRSLARSPALAAGDPAQNLRVALAGNSQPRPARGHHRRRHPRHPRALDPGFLPAPLERNLSAPTAGSQQGLELDGGGRLACARGGSRPELPFHFGILQPHQRTGGPGALRRQFRQQRETEPRRHQRPHGFQFPALAGQPRLETRRPARSQCTIPRPAFEKQKRLLGQRSETHVAAPGHAVFRRRGSANDSVSSTRSSNAPAGVGCWIIPISTRPSPALRPRTRRSPRQSRAQPAGNVCRNTSHRRRQQDQR